MKKITLLNTTICTAPGSYSLRAIDLEEAKALLEERGYESAIGHEATAQILTDLLGVPVSMNRVQYAQQPGDTALCFKLRGRPPEGKILTREEVEGIGYDFQLLRRRLENVDVTVHGSVLSHAPGLAHDIDVVASEDSERVRQFVRDEARERGWPEVPIDLVVVASVPTLPLALLTPSLTLCGKGLAVRPQYDLAAWVRACEVGGIERQAFSAAVNPMASGSPFLDSRMIGVRGLGVALVLREDCSTFAAPYHGGGRKALLRAKTKAPAGYEFCLSRLPAAGRKFIEAWLETGELPEWVQKILPNCPAASEQEVTLTKDGIYAAYAQSLTRWPETYATFDGPDICGNCGKPVGACCTHETPPETDAASRSTQAIELSTALGGPADPKGPQEDGQTDFGACGMCGNGRYTGPTGALFGACDNCGAV